eukprot:9484564-Pyramimonas_sp.AAC.1
MTLHDHPTDLLEIKEALGSSPHGDELHDARGVYENKWYDITAFGLQTVLDKLELDEKLKSDVQDDIQ